MAKILILGAGVMGTAFSVPLCDAGQDVHLVGTHLDREWIEGIRATGVHPKLKSTVPEGVAPYTHDQLGDALTEDTDLIVLGVSSPGVDWAIRQLGPVLRRPIPIVMLTKGLAVRNDTLEILPHVVRDGLAEYGIEGIPVGAVGGPCIAGELAAKRDSSVVIACADAAVLNRIMPLVDAPYYHARPSADIIGVEVCAAMKNFYALAVGSVNGLLEKQGKASNGALMHNLAAGLFTQAIAEIGCLVEYLGGTAASVHGLPGTGDLYVTCQAGRNSRMGRLLGLGLRYREAKATHMADETVEGADLALTIGSTLELLLECRHLEPSALPLAAAIIQAICHNHPLQIPWEHFYPTG
ncbi:glycerol-3-phosphate dehydrogenase [candidate division KSB3 bacterium]|uniref:Glycerol-3-phosphate dehydrogenase n=1 Tax=candidate division KSB3 bacterium TaxID=2044937 RepID=A0A9D5JU43_9BACT|nr:glycerol-3-phosphate dehydrogenase [candidate division KSB3 bacterium]MBD3324273.1 glycerol-3-phosphate dehydrogenase [candidate division KSB3 bacterium]